MIDNSKKKWMVPDVLKIQTLLIVDNINNIHQVSAFFQQFHRSMIILEVT